jgi:hypothetical protein
MRTRIRHWVIVGVTLAIVLGVSLRAPDAPGDRSPLQLRRATPARMPDVPGPRIRPRPQIAPPLDRVDPRRFLLYTTPALEKRRQS